MADIDIAVDSGDLKAAIDLLGRLGDEFVKTTNQIQTQSNRMARASKATSDQIDQAFNKIVGDKLQRDINQAKGYWQSYDQALGITGKRATEVGASFSALQKEIDNLTKEYNPLAAATEYYNKEVDKINRTHQLSIITTEELENHLKRLDTEYQALSKGVYLAGSRFNQFGGQLGIAGKSAGRFGMYAQQAGYQLGDFAVQLQSGTNVGVAFSQQFAQLAGLIPGVAGAITTFAAIGLGLLIQNLTKGEKKAEDFKSVVSDFDKFATVFESAGESLEGSFGIAIDNVATKYGNLVALITSNNSKDAIDTLVKGLQSTTPRAGVFDPTGENSSFGSKALGGAKVVGGGVLFGPSRYFENIKEAKEANVAIDKLRSAYEELRQQSNLTTGEMAKELERVALAILASTEYTEAQKKALVGMLDEMDWDKVLVAIADAQEEQNKKANELKATLQQELELRRLALQYGEDSVQVRLAELDAEHAKTLATIEALDVTSELKAELEAAADANYAAESATIAWGNSLGYVKNQIAGIASILSSIGGGMISNAEKFTTAKLIQEGATRVQAEKQVRYASEDRKYELQKQQNLSQYGKIIGPALNVGLSLQHQGGRNADEALLAAYELDAERSKASGGGKGGKGSGSGGKGRLSDAEKDAEKATEKLEEFFDQFKKGVEQQERLLGVYGDQREELEKVIEIENRLGDARHLVSQKQIEAMANEELALERRLEKEQELYELGSQNVENLLMTIVSGTSSIEDAFRGMLANIISEVYQQYVAKGAADWAGNAIVSLFSAKGNAFGTGGIKMFANGGVVNAPTLFGYNNGKTGMMGEAGPEAIMPLKRNSQGKLGVEVSGGGGSVVNVHNNFNVSANGDESVTRIIQAQIPKITEASTMAIIDAKRRGRKGL